MNRVMTAAGIVLVAFRILFDRYAAKQLPHALSIALYLLAMGLLLVGMVLGRNA